MVWSPSQQMCLHTLKDHTSDIDAISWSPVAMHAKQHLLATASQDQTVRWVVLG